MVSNAFPAQDFIWTPDTSDLLIDNNCVIDCKKIHLRRPSLISESWKLCF
jgi:hypothetical protein